MDYYASLLATSPERADREFAQGLNEGRRQARPASRTQPREITPAPYEVTVVRQHTRRKPHAPKVARPAQVGNVRCGCADEVPGKYVFYRDGRQQTGVCFRCRGKAYQTPEDQRRNAYYDRLRHNNAR